MRSGERGQILPGLLVVLLAVLALGMLLFQVGKAAVLRSDAQTAADAAALAGANEIKRQLMAQWATAGTTDINLIDQALVRVRMRDYAKRNGATLLESSVVIQGVDVKAAVTTDEDVGAGAKDLDREDAKGEARARARIEISATPGIGGSIGPLPGGGGGGAVPKISDKEWKEIKEKLGSGAPDCDDMVALGRFLADQGFDVAENSAFGPVGKHSDGSYHYQCGGRGAIDVNFGRAGDLVPEEVAAVDPVIAPLRELGFRTIWRAADHYNHLHVDVANSGPIGAGSGGQGGGFTGPLEDVLLRGPADRLGRAHRPVLRLRRRRRRLLHGPARSEGGARDLLRGARPRRLRQGDPGGLRGGDRRVRRPQPALRRPRLDRALPAARLVGQLRPAHGSLLGLAPVPGQGDPAEPAVDDGGPARPGRAGLGLPRALRPAPGPGALADLDLLLEVRRAALILAVLALAGCGASEAPERAAAPALPEGDFGPEQPGSGERARPVAPPRKAPAAAVAGELAAGTVGVVGVEGAVGVRPRTLEVAADATIEDVRWERWDASGAEGAGTLSVRDCDPTCASGDRDESPATVRLSAPRPCGRSTYFDRARVELDGARAGGDPISYVRAPC